MRGPTLRSVHARTSPVEGSGADRKAVLRGLTDMGLRSIVLFDSIITIYGSNPRFCSLFGFDPLFWKFISLILSRLYSLPLLYSLAYTLSLSYTPSLILSRLYSLLLILSLPFRPLSLQGGFIGQTDNDTDKSSRQKKTSERSLPPFLSLLNAVERRVTPCNPFCNAAPPPCLCLMGFRLRRGERAHRSNPCEDW